MECPPIALVPMSHIDPPRDAHRLAVDEQRLGELADSMAAEGLHQPIGVRAYGMPERLEVIYGHRRYLAARMLGWTEIEVRNYPAGADVLLIRASENNNREQLSPAEEAEQVRRFRDAGYSRAGMARALRKSVGWVETRLALLECPQDIRTAVHVGQLSLAVAVRFAAIDHEPYRRELIGEATRTGCTALQADAWVAAYAADRERIVHNLATVEDIAASREKFVIKIGCDACAGEFRYEQTRTMRFCLACTATLQAALAAEAWPDAR